MADTNQEPQYQAHIPGGGRPSVERLESLGHLAPLFVADGLCRDCGRTFTPAFTAQIICEACRSMFWAEWQHRRRKARKARPPVTKRDGHSPDPGQCDGDDIPKYNGTNPEKYNDANPGKCDSDNAGTYDDKHSGQCDGDHDGETISRNAV